MMEGEKVLSGYELRVWVKKAENGTEREENPELILLLTNRMGLEESLVFSDLICSIRVTSDDRQVPQKLYCLMVLDIEMYVPWPKFHECMKPGRQRSAVQKAAGLWCESDVESPSPLTSCEVLGKSLTLSGPLLSQI